MWLAIVRYQTSVFILCVLPPLIWECNPGTSRHLCACSSMFVPIHIVLINQLLGQAQLGSPAVKDQRSVQEC